MHGMGFWETFVVHRGDRSLTEAPDVDDFADVDECLKDGPPGGPVWPVYTSLDERPEGFLRGARRPAGTS